MCCNHHLIIFGCCNNSVHFVLSKLWPTPIFCNAQYATSCRDLNKVRAFLVSLPYCLISIFWPIDHSSFGPGSPIKSFLYPLVGSACPPVLAMDLPAVKTRGPITRPELMALRSAMFT